MSVSYSILFFCVCTYLYLCVYRRLSLPDTCRYPQRPEGIGCPRTGDIGGCELTDVGAGNWIQVFYRRNKHFKHLSTHKMVTILSALVPIPSLPSLPHHYSLCHSVSVPKTHENMVSNSNLQCGRGFSVCACACTHRCICGVCAHTWQMCGYLKKTSSAHPLVTFAFCLRQGLFTQWPGTSSCQPD